MIEIMLNFEYEGYLRSKLYIFVYVYKCFLIGFISEVGGRYWHRFVKSVILR